MITQVYSLWALFFGIGLITIGNGLRGTLFGVRGSMEGFSIIHVISDIFVLTRIKTSVPVPLEAQEAFAPILPRTSPAVVTLAPNSSDESVESTDN